MKTNAPKQVTWLIALIVGLLGLIGHFVNIPYVTEYQYWLVVIAWAILVLANMMKGL